MLSYLRIVWSICLTLSLFLALPRILLYAFPQLPQFSRLFFSFSALSRHRNHTPPPLSRPHPLAKKDHAESLFRGIEFVLPAEETGRDLYLLIKRIDVFKIHGTFRTPQSAYLLCICITSICTLDIYHRESHRKRFSR